MSKVAVIYHSYRGTTPKLVEALKKGVEAAGGQCSTLSASDSNPEDVLGSDILVFACGQPFGTVAGPIKTFIERCWNYAGKDQLSGKKYATIVNGAKDPKDTVAYLEGILPYFKLEKAAEGITCLGNDIESALSSCEHLGKILVQN